MHAHKSGVICRVLSKAFKQKKIKALQAKMTKIASRGPALRVSFMQNPESAKPIEAVWPTMYSDSATLQVLPTDSNLNAQSVWQVNKAYIGRHWAALSKREQRPLPAAACVAAYVQFESVGSAASASVQVRLSYMTLRCIHVPGVNTLICYSSLEILAGSSFLNQSQHTSL